MNTFHSTCLLSLGLVVACGCRREETAIVEFEPNMVFAYNMADFAEQPMERAAAETSLAVLDLFGTPDLPRWPEFLADEGEEFAQLVDREHLERAAGPLGAGRGLYRKHCATCHGITGNGRGPLSAGSNPYPRDYRLGKFKFKNTPIGSKPTKEDLTYLIANGIPGTQMGKIEELTPEDIEALVDYVVYLSVRGEVERELLFFAGDELDYLDEEEPESLYDPSLNSETASDEDKELFEEQWETIQDIVFDVTEEWVEAPEKVKPVPERDPSLVPDTAEEVLAALASEGESPIKESVARGRELFLGERASCSKCHGKTGKGDGQTNDYDAWAKDWTSRFGIDPTDEEAHIPLLVRGALPVRKVSPRNFEEGVFRGGSQPEHLYQRIALGIEGSPMPAAPLKPEEIWDLINFVRSLVVPKEEEEGMTAEPPAEQVAAFNAVRKGI